jgi:hypothetical protein
MVPAERAQFVQRRRAMAAAVALLLVVFRLSVGSSGLQAAA